ncbi:MAG: DAK2 domain-containing protein [Bacteroidales bacterium]|nr:DAK2 domain-containing protein [Bacteroidales bacterium]
MIEIDSLTFSAMLRQGTVALGKEKGVINDLNVFPIPDGDTGDNMYMTMKAGVSAASEANPMGTAYLPVGDTLGAHGVASLASAASSGMLLGARGNSGVILSRIFAGLAKGLKDVAVADTKTFDHAMHAAVDEAYKAVPVPVEGTMITVMREGVAGADASGDMNHYFETLLEAMQTSLDHTPELLQVLKDAGVVDSGGAGVLCVFRGMNDALCGRITDEELLPSKVETPTVDLNKFNENSTLEFGYCTEFLLRLLRAKVDLETFDEQVIIDYLNRVGESVVAFREGTIVKVHVHTYTPGVILNEMQKYGEFLTIKIENMALQHHQETNQNNASFKKPKQKYGVVTVASGQGLMDAFREIGADEVIAGGQTMNPSTQDFIEAFRRINAQHILVFPNNSNIKMAAEQAAGLYTESDVRVMPSASIGEGYFGIGSIDRDCANVEEVIESVTEAMQTTVSGMVSTAIRDAEGEVSVHTGDFVGYSGKQILSDSPLRKEAAMELLRRLNIGSRDVMIVFYGNDVPAEEADALITELQNNYKNIEIINICGLQPVYDYIFALC